MDRETAQELFSAYREGDLPPDEAARFEALLGTDEELRQEYSLFCRALESLDLLREEEAPDDFVEQVKGRIRRRSGGAIFGSQRGAVWTRVPYEFFSLLLILIILAFYLLTLPIVSPGGDSAESPDPESPPTNSSP